MLAIVVNGECLVRQYVSGLTPSEKKKIWALLERTGDHGTPKNTQKFNHLEGDLYEFKSFQDRLFCFFDGVGRIVITHGWKKKRDRATKEEIQRSFRLMKDYRDAKQAEEQE